MPGINPHAMVGLHGLTKEQYYHTLGGFRYCWEARIAGVVVRQGVGWIEDTDRVGALELVNRWNLTAQTQGGLARWAYALLS